MTPQIPFTTLKESCLATLAYFDLFDYPLTLEELQHYFLGELPSLEVLQSFLSEKSSGVQYKDSYYYLTGREITVSLRNERKVTAEKYWKKVKTYIPFIQFVPFLTMVGICNTLAINNTTEESDIDLFIVAKPGRLFVVRFLTVALFSLLGVRRHKNKIAGRFCLSFYVDETALNLQPIQDGNTDIYLPFWILTMKPLYGESVYKKFIQQNNWIMSYFRHPLSFDHEFWKPNVPRRIAAIKEFLLRGFIGNIIEKKLREIQMKRHVQNIKNLPNEASIVVTDHMLKFHNIDRRKKIAEEFEKRFQEIMGRNNQ